MATTLTGLVLCAQLATSTSAHPGSGIVVDKQGQIFFTDTGQGVWKIDNQGKLSYLPAWTCLSTLGLHEPVALMPTPSEKITLWGSSYGNHLALGFISRDEKSFHRAILSGGERKTSILGQLAIEAQTVKKSHKYKLLAQTPGYLPFCVKTFIMIL